MLIQSTFFPPPLCLFDGKVCAQCGQWHPCPDFRLRLHVEDPLLARRLRYLGFDERQRYCALAAAAGYPLSHIGKSLGAPVSKVAVHKLLKRVYARFEDEEQFDAGLVLIDWIEENAVAPEYVTPGGVWDRNDRCVWCRFPAEPPKKEPPAEKRCSKCKRILPVDSFYIRRPKKCPWPHHRSECKECTAVAFRRWRQENPQRWRDAMSRRDPMRLREYARRYHAEHPERLRERARVMAAKRRAWKLGAGAHFSANEWRALCARYDYRCLACGERKPLEADHVIPLSRGGCNDISNIQCLCRSCNSKKNARTIDYRPRWNLV